MLTKNIEYHIDSNNDMKRLYYQIMLEIYKANDISIDFILILSNYIYRDNSIYYFRNDKKTREEICRQCNIKTSMYDKYINRCKKKNIIFPTEYRGIYETSSSFYMNKDITNLNIDLNLKENFIFIRHSISENH